MTDNDDDARLLYLCAELDRAHAQAYDAPDVDDIDDDEMSERLAAMFSVMHALAPIRATTQAGRVAKAKVALMLVADRMAQWKMEDFELDMLFAFSALHDLVGNPAPLLGLDDAVAAWDD